MRAVWKNGAEHNGGCVSDRPHRKVWSRESDCGLTLSAGWELCAGSRDDDGGPPRVVGWSPVKRAPLWGLFPASESHEGRLVKQVFGEVE